MTHPSNVETDNPTPTLALLSHNALLAVGTRSSKVAKNIRMTITSSYEILNMWLHFQDITSRSPASQFPLRIENKSSRNEEREKAVCPVDTACYGTLTRWAILQTSVSQSRDLIYCLNSVKVCERASVSCSRWLNNIFLLSLSRSQYQRPVGVVSPIGTSS